MANAPNNHRREWTTPQKRKLERLAEGETPLGRTEAAVRQKASENDVSQRPTNQSPSGASSPVP